MRCSGSGAFLQQIVHQTTHSLARFFLEVDANYKQFKTASRLRAAAAAAARGPEGVLRGGADHDRPLPRCGRPVRRRRRARGPVQDHLQHLDRRAGGGQGDAARRTTTSRWPKGPSPRKAYIQARDQQAAHVQLPIPHDGPYQPEADQRPGQSRPGRPDGAPGPGPRRPPAAPAGPGRPARPAPHAGAAAGPRRRARHPLAGRSPGPPSRRWSPSRLRTSRLDPLRPRTCPRCRSRSTCPPCRRSDRDRTPERLRPLPGRPLPSEGVGPSPFPGRASPPMNRDEPHPSSVVQVRFAPRIKTLLTLGSVVRPE